MFKFARNLTNASRILNPEVPVSSRKTITNLTCNNHWRHSRKYGKYEIVKPGVVSRTQYVPSHILKPPYAESGVVPVAPSEAEVKTPEEIKRTQEACHIARLVLDRVSEFVCPGITTDELDRIAHTVCIEYNAYPSPLNYRWFPKSICTSVNNVAAHGIPDDRVLKEGDVISIDVSVFFNGYHGDCATSLPVGTIDDRATHLLSVAKHCLNVGIAACKDGAPLNVIGSAISMTAEAAGCSVVPSFCGHGIGTYFHGLPDIYHFEHDSEEVMLEGMTFTIEPVISEGGSEIVVLDDGWTAVTTDESRTAQFEHTILITQNGAQVLTI